MTLTLVSAETDYIVREDSETYEEHVTTLLPIAVPLIMWDDFDLSDAYMAAVQRHRDTPPPGPYTYRPARAGFVTEVMNMVADSENVELVWCESCDEPVKSDEAEAIDDGHSHACTSCYEDNYRGCDDCGSVFHYDNGRYTLADETVCERCCDNNYSYCEDCDGYYHDSYGDEHSHGSCDCDVPTLHLAMRHGDGTLAADERISVTLPSGVVSEEGMHSISRLIREHSHSVVQTPEGTWSDPGFQEKYEAACNERNKWWILAQDVYTMDAEWTTKAGNFTKRLSKLAHKNHGLKVPADLLTKIGNVGRDNSNGAELEIELTRNLNMSAEEFYHEDSCWWQSYGDSRCSLKTNGGFAIRSFTDGTRYQPVSGRVFVMPLRLTEPRGTLTPTFDAASADAYVVFNGYGDLSGYTPARIVADMAGMTYRKISFDCNPMYVNSGAGYIVAPEELADKVYASGLHLDTDTHSFLYHREISAARQAELVSA